MLEPLPIQPWAMEADAQPSGGTCMISVILCDDHALIRRGIRDTLCDAADIEVVGEAGDYGELRA